MKETQTVWTGTSLPFPPVAGSVELRRPFGSRYTAPTWYHPASSCFGHHSPNPVNRLLWKLHHLKQEIHRWGSQKLAPASEKRGGRHANKSCKQKSPRSTIPVRALTAIGAKSTERKQSGCSAKESRSPRLQVWGAIHSFSRENLKGKQEPVPCTEDVKPPITFFPATAEQTSRKKWSYGDGERPMPLESILNDWGTQFGSLGDMLKSGPTLLFCFLTKSAQFS